MTAILGYARDGKVWMAGDSAAMDGWTRIILDEQKVFRHGDVLIGGSGLLHVVQEIRLTVEIPEHPDGMKDQLYLITKLLPAMRKSLEDASKSTIEAEGSTALMVGYHGVLWYVTPSMMAVAHKEQLYALGSGGDIALGAFEALMECRPDAIERNMLRALEIAGRSNMTVAPPYYVECLP